MMIDRDMRKERVGANPGYSAQSRYAALCSISIADITIKEL
jgi:hypothetical protein